MNRVAFLDRDDTIVKNIPYCSRPEDLVLLDGAGLAINKLNEAGFLVILVTNQSGINRNFFNRQDLRLIHDKLCELLAEKDATIDKILYCPHRPDEYCKCRKPRVGMFEEAFRLYDFDIDSSFMVGDAESDIIAGENFGLKTILIAKKNKVITGKKPDFVAVNLLQAVNDYILGKKQSYETRGA